MKSTKLFLSLLLSVLVFQTFAQSNETAVAHKWIIQSITVNGAADADRYPVNNDVMQFNADHSFHSVDNTYNSQDDGHWKLIDPNTVQMDVMRNGQMKTYTMKIISVNAQQLILQFQNSDGETVQMTLKIS